LASRLLTAARLESAEFKPQREPVLFSQLIHLAIQKLDDEANRERFRVCVPSPEASVFAEFERVTKLLGHDSELMQVFG
jgi:hypothetical protein